MFCRERGTRHGDRDQQFVKGEWNQARMTPPARDLARCQQNTDSKRHEAEAFHASQITANPLPGDMLFQHRIRIDDRS